MARPAPTPEEKAEQFFSKFKPLPSGCWEWIANKAPSGYGQFRKNTHKNMRAHRFSYEFFRGPIPDGLVIDHLCLKKDCVNPCHLEVVTVKENTLRGIAVNGHINAMKTHCKQGHEYTPENTLKKINNRNGSIGRGCRACRDKSNAARYPNAKRNK
jgi:hypothetical protein